MSDHVDRAEGKHVSPVSVAILCGGTSRRMGSDKALLQLAPETPTLLELVISAVRDLSPDVFLVGEDRPGYTELGIPLLIDRFPGSGPLGGIATGLAACKFEHCLVVACDMPFLCRPLLAAMAAVPRDSYDVLVPLVSEPDTAPDGVIAEPVLQTLHAIYARRCLPTILSHLDLGHRRVSAFYSDVEVQVVDFALIQRYDPLSRSFYSVNTPDQLLQARAWQAKVAGTTGDLL